jgi:hypothetical protein
MRNKRQRDHDKIGAVSHHRFSVFLDQEQKINGRTGATGGRAGGGVGHIAAASMLANSRFYTKASPSRSMATLSPRPS